MSDDPVVVVGGARTPVGRFGGALKDVEASDLAGVAITAALDRAGVAADEVDEVIMGQVGQVGGDAYNARRCALVAGIPVRATAMNVNRLCGSGLQAIAVAARSIMFDDVPIAAAGGAESISLVQNEHANTYRNRDETILATKPELYLPMIDTAEVVAERSFVVAAVAAPLLTLGSSWVERRLLLRALWYRLRHGRQGANA